MSSLLTKKQIGKRLSQLRKAKGFSQEDLAKLLKLSRPSLAQIELGNRSVDVLELIKFSMALGFSLDEFVSNKYNTNQNLGEPEVLYSAKTAKSIERISKPVLNVAKFKTVILYILEKCAGKPNVNESALYKLLYFSDFNYYELYEEHMTGATYLKLPYGPVPQKLDLIMNQMIEEKQVMRIKTEYFGMVQTRYIPLAKSNLTLISGAEKEVIDHLINQMSDWSTALMNDYTHLDLPWVATEEGQEIRYNLAFYREIPYAVRVYDETENND